MASCGDDSAATCGNGALDTGEDCDEGASNGTRGHCRADCSGIPTYVSVEGDVLPFLTEVSGKRISGATVSVLEHPEMHVVTGDDAHFRFDDVEVGSDLTLVVEAPSLKTTQTATLVVGPNGVNPFSVQVVPTGVFNAVSALVPLPIEEDKYCVIASTAVRFGGSLYVRLRQGLPGVNVTLEPAAPAESGPLYFNEAVVPDPEQDGTSIDGGVLYYRVPPGDYVMSAAKVGHVFGTVRLKCRAGVIVNAGPALGLLADEVDPDFAAGTDRPADARSASTDAMCEATAACVNAASGKGTYPEATLSSCKAMFRNVWAEVDADCDAESGVGAAARAVYDCRSVDCDVTLGGDDACATEETSFRAAEDVYGACVVAK